MLRTAPAKGRARGSRPRPAMRRRLQASAGLLTAVLLTAVGCSGDVSLDGDDPEELPTSSSPEALPISVAREPEASTTLAATDDSEQLAVAVSRTYLTQAQVAVLAPASDRGAVLRAASVGRATGAPVLLSGADPAELDTELLRLGVAAVVTVGAVDLTAVDTTSLVVAPAPDDVGELGELLATELTEVSLPDGEPADDVASLLGLGEGEVFAVGDLGDTGTSTDGATDTSGDAADASSSDASESDSASPSETGTGEVDAPTAAGTMPELEPATPVADSLVLTSGAAAQLAAVGTAAGVGAQVLRVPDDVRGSADAVEQIHDAAASTVVGLGTGFGDEEQLAWRTETAATGQQLPAGGQLVLPGAHYIALYGSPVTPALGVLGEQGTSETIERAAQTAADYDDLVPGTVVPALEIIVTVASSSAGEDGNYSREWPSEEFLPLVEAAQEAGQYVVLDFQPGRTSFVDQIRDYEDLLAYPHVGIALDPEWRLESDQVHLAQIGSVGIDEVNAVVDWTADYVRENRLPQKLIVLHQFQLRMISDREDLDTSRSEVALLIHADGQGSQPAKQDTWRALHADAPEGIFWGWKNFVDEDSPMLTPEQTVADVDPLPDFVSYQ